MRKVLLIASLFLSAYASSQANLVLSSTINITSNTFAKGNYITFSFSVKNTGNAAAPKSHTSIYLSQTTSSSAGILLSELSCEAIASNQQSSTINYIFPVPYNIPTGANYIIFEIDSRNEVVESNESNGFYLTSPITITSNIVNNQNLPYPVLFIHGLNSDNKTWNSALVDLQNYFGWSYGGNINFCLNQSSTSTDKVDDVQSWTSLSSLSKGDFYTLNFDVDRSGSPYPLLQFIYSNQASIVKQGLAVKEAISYVLSKTGKDKVILVGHSMGGLASREYLENLKQPDGKHHVAKLLTVGTPHGGSNSSSYGFAIGLGLYEKSEAVRDLRTTYSSYGDSGVYLFGGREYYSRMQDGILDFTNVDVNCNGIGNTGDSITGLNKKPIPQDLSYSCIIGTGNALGGDGVVDADKADLKKYYPTTLIDTFIIAQPLGSIGIWHTQLTEQTEAIVKGMDEPDTKKFAYKADIGKYNFGHFTERNGASISLVDSDYYKITIPTSGKFTFNMYDIPTPQVGLGIIDSATNIIQTTYYSNGKGAIGLTNNNISPGTYYLNIFSKPDTYTWKFPYAHRVDFTTLIPITGNIISPKNIIVKNAIINLSKDSISSILSDLNGKYNFTLSKIGNYTIRPSKNNDITKANGVTSIDVLLTQRHILNTTKLNSAYKLIAADVDGNKAINSVDVLRMKRLILGTDTTFTSATKGNRLWEFVDSAYQFPDTTNPFPFKDSISFTNLTSNKINQTFIGIKLGDVNYDWNALVAKGVEAKPVEFVYHVISMKEKSNQTDFSGTNLRNDEIRVPISVNNFKDIAAMQYTLHFDNTKYEFVNLKGFKNLEGFEYNAAQANTSGNISMLWTDRNAVERTLEDGTELFTLVLRSTVDGRLSTDLTLTSDITEIEAWDKHYNKHHIVLTKRETRNDKLETRNEVVIYPNPTKGLVNLYIETLVGKGNIIITDVYGKQVKTQPLSLGTNTIDVSTLSKGMYFVSSITNEGKTTKKLVVE